MDMDQSLRLMDKRLEDLEDVAAFDAAKAEGGENYPAWVVNWMMAGVPPLLAYRVLRGMSHSTLSNKAGVVVESIVRAERGDYVFSTTSIDNLAKALSVDVEDLT